MIHRWEVVRRWVVEAPDAASAVAATTSSTPNETLVVQADEGESVTILRTRDLDAVNGAALDAASQRRRDLGIS